MRIFERSWVGQLKLFLSNECGEWQEGKHMHPDPVRMVARTYFQLHEIRSRLTRRSCFMKWVWPMLFTSQVGWNPGGYVGIFSNPLEHNWFILFSLSGRLWRKKKNFGLFLLWVRKIKWNKAKQASEIQSLKWQEFCKVKKYLHTFENVAMELRLRDELMCP